MEHKKDVAELLLANGADVNARNKEAETPLHLAAWRRCWRGNKVALAELLLANKADVNARANNGETPLHQAAKGGNEDVAELLLANGADVNAKDNRGDTPLASAVRWEKKAVAKVLVANGGDNGLTATAADITEGNQYDLIPLIQRRVIRASITGDSISVVNARFENWIGKKLNVVIRPGTMFVSSGAHQNMVSTSEKKFVIEPYSTEGVHISAACLNAARPIPRETDSFDEVTRASKDVARFLEASKDESAMVIQAGVWALTDQYSRSDVMARLIRSDRSKSSSSFLDSLDRSRSAVTDWDCDRAGAILNRLGIPNRLAK